MHSSKQAKAIPDPDVITKVIEGETNLFEILIRKNNPYLYKMGRSYGFNHHDTEDLMQDAFIAAYLNLKKFQQRSTFRTWVIKIMLNLCYRRSHKPSFKYEKPVSAVFKNEIPPMIAVNEDRDGFQTTLKRELIHVIESALTDLPLEYRLVFS